MSIVMVILMAAAAIRIGRDVIMDMIYDIEEQRRPG